MSDVRGAGRIEIGLEEVPFLAAGVLHDPFGDSPGSARLNVRVNLGPSAALLRLLKSNLLQRCEVGLDRRDLLGGAHFLELVEIGSGVEPRATNEIERGRRNLVAAFVYNIVCIPIAAAGLLSPVLASAAMSLSSVSVLVSSLRLRRYR